MSHSQPQASSPFERSKVPAPGNLGISVYFCNGDDLARYTGPYRNVDFQKFFAEIPAQRAHEPRGQCSRAETSPVKAVANPGEHLESLPNQAGCRRVSNNAALLPDIEMRKPSTKRFGANRGPQWKRRCFVSKTASVARFWASGATRLSTRSAVDAAVRSIAALGDNR